MRNLFEVDSNEMRRILSLHKESTKKQYLNVISEQTNPDGQSFTLSNDVNLENETSGQSELKLFKGAVFKIANKNLLYSKTNYQFAGTMFGNTGGKKATPGVIWYRCDTGKYSVKGQDSVKYYSPADNPGLNEIAKNLCAKSKTFVPKKKTTQQTPKTSEKSKVKTGYVAPLNPQQITDTIKQVQQSVGIQNPTGQITDTDVDTLIAKLSEN